MNALSIQLKKIRDLTVESAIQPGRPPFISAASGLVEYQGAWVVVSDDDDAIARFFDGKPGVIQRVFSDDLPLEKKARKKVKSDLEALTVVGDELLAIPSGSKQNRSRGALIREQVRVVDFSYLFSRLTDELGPLNIEGAVFAGPMFWLFNRGNSTQARNAVVVLDATQAQRELGQLKLLSHERSMTYDLGSISGVRLCFTDACPDGHGGALFIAAAENTNNAYDDGVCVGSAMGRIAADGRLDWVRPLNCPQKPEGIWRDISGDVRIVTDADDAQIPAGLYEVTEKI